MWASGTTGWGSTAPSRIARRNAPIELVRQVVYQVDRERKRELLTHLVRTRVIDQALVFTRTKHGANKLAEQLNKDGIAAYNALVDQHGAFADTLRTF